MEFLSWLFFCLSPFALFCSENGNGLILCPVFIILGFVFKYVGSNSGGTPTKVVKVEPQNFWEWHYKDRISSALAQKNTISDGLMALKDKEARQWATSICGYHNAWVPPEEKQEQIARANGVITEQMVKEKTENKDRVQIGKYFLMCELEEKYHTITIKDKTGKNCCYPDMTIEEDKYNIESSDGHQISDYWVQSTYNKSINEMWKILSENERAQATEWIEEYERKLIKAAHDYVDEDLYCMDSIKIDY